MKILAIKTLLSIIASHDLVCACLGELQNTTISIYYNILTS